MSLSQGTACFIYPYRLRCTGRGLKTHTHRPQMVYTVLVVIIQVAYFDWKCVFDDPVSRPL
ncbi:hypothetical protein [Pectinatus sottacetonis]|uniref:hypothetical protein n=1 Tax=Pectinatus sottacetonis TaxID=1002795 RepID=UPI0018C83D2B|nr:hypothetical protein [Pectinatus sottacetonis]